MIGEVSEIAAVHAINLVAHLQAVGAAEFHRESGGVVTIGIRTGHGVSAEVGVRRGGDCGGVFLKDGVIATVEVRVDLDLGYAGVARIRLELDRE